ncbi:MAG: alpha,alpha-trehalase TreF [Bacteroidia bacterium]|nr:alpha,alpha-trehalase TreF [Bacteroidia bacterium]
MRYSSPRLLGSLLLLASFIACQPQTSQEQPATTPPTSFISPVDQYPGLFEAVQLGDVFPDTKTFADCSPKATSEIIMREYLANKDRAGFSLAAFVEEWFERPHQYASGFHADTSLTLAEHINQLWPILTRQPDSDSTGTLIPLPHSYIVPGGRFGEIYYWDSYFTMLGLQASPNHKDMIHNMVDNFAYLINSVGYIPNGNRTYFLGRSQPPFFSMMVRLLAETDTTVKMSDYLAEMETEYLFWMEGDRQLTEAAPAHRRVVRMPDGSFLNRYWDDKPAPRPESYQEDVLLAAETPDREPEQLYRDLRAACESGWDFSTRWLSDPNDLGSIHTTEIIPVDLNALMYHMEITLAEAAREAGLNTKAEDFEKWAAERKAAINYYLWDEGAAMYSDYLWTENTPTGVASLAMSFPLWMKIATNEQAAATAKILEEQFLSPGGLVTTLYPSGQQWDAPNGWAPLQYASIAGLLNYQHNDLVGAISRRWIDLNTRVFKQTGKLTEKYNVIVSDTEAGGGEYPVQDGFGWTNGVLLHLLTDQRVPAL